MESLIPLQCHIGHNELMNIETTGSTACKCQELFKKLVIEERVQSICGKIVA